LGEFDFQTRHISGSSNAVADGLSRTTCFVGKQSNSSNDAAVNVSEYGDDTKLLHSRLLISEHNAVAGHHPSEVMVERLKDRGLSWATVADDAKLIVQQCGICQKTAPFVQSAALHGPSYSTAGKAVFSDVMFDHVGPFHADQRGNKYVLVFVCQLSRYCVLFPTITKDAEETAAALLSLVCVYGVPHRVSSDRGGAFISNVMEAYTRMMGIKHTLHTPYHHQEAGRVERQNRNMLKQIRRLVMEARVNETWSQYLPLCQRVMNMSVNSVTGLAPFHLVLSANVWNLLEREKLASVDAESPLQRNFVQLERALGTLAEQNQQMVKKENKTPAVVLPSWVLVYQERGHKLQPPWKGPCKVVQQMDDHGIVELFDLVKKENFKVHVSKIKQYNGSTAQPDLMKLAELDVDEYEIEKIIDHHPLQLSGPRKSWLFKVRWVGYSEEYDEWLSYADLANTEKLTEYLKEKQG